MGYNLNLPLIALEFAAFLFALSFHEAAHAWVASLRGDQTARLLGRISLNPVKHIDLFGTIIVPIVTMLASPIFIGWAKPTPVDVSRLKNRKWDDILVSVAGPASNVLLAVLSIAGIWLVQLAAPAAMQAVLSDPGKSHPGSSIWIPIGNLLFFSLIINVVLAVFNLLPIPPLDGSHILRHFLPRSLSGLYESLYRNGFAALVLLMLVVYFGISDRFFSPILGAFTRFLP